MTKISIQFHAGRDEIATWLADWAKEYRLAVAVESFLPQYSARLCDVADLPVELAGSSEINRVSLNLLPIDVSAASALDFMRSNPNVLTVSLGTQSRAELREAALSAMTDDDESIKTWRAIRLKLRKSLLSGSTVVNPVTGAEQPAKGHYYSKGAREMANRGVRLLASAGWNEYRLDD
ncbi:hypothetical protein [Pseudosporangium ferrugineum]|uniref:hypothetical protein n=1 Tax=Pseudosporangium ferrugineum TaxID=439699 RepID=UPI0011B256BD|nr:hypothetical protein [Pseudosporangium ferrugineum]